MANANRGEIALKVGEKEYTLRYSTNALCDLEATLNKPITEITDLMSDPKQISLTATRALLWAGLREHHPKITLQQAGDIVQELTMSIAILNIGNAFQAAFPSDDKGEGDRPQKLDGQPSGTGPASIPAG